ncbi:MAG: diguanylate cyclase, partial [Actinobacteria bacterium]|nr:diguanylate cyclase [Actinomycetota bacterium]
MTRRVHWPGVDGYLAQIHPAGIAQGLADVVRAILDGTSEDDLLTMLPPLLGHEIPGAVATIGAGWDGYRFNRVFGARHLSLGDPSPDDVDAIETVLRTSGVTDLTDVVSTATMARGQAAGHGALWGAPIVTATGDASDTAMFVWHWTEGPPGRIMRRRVERLVDLARLVEGWGSQRRELMWRVAHDALTGLVNRSTFTAALAESGGRARALLYCDLDDFKPVNDEFGHVAGDRVLAVVADRMANAAWGHTVAR